MDIALYNFFAISINNFIDWISDNINSVNFNPFPEKIFFAVMRIRQKNRAGMVNNLTIYLFRNPIIKAPVARLQMVNRNPQTFGYYTDQAAVCISQDKNFIRTHFIDNSFGFHEYFSYLFPEGFSLHAKIEIGLADMHIIKEYLIKVIIIVLAGMDKRMFAPFIKRLYNERQADYLRPSTENCHYLHLKSCQ